MLRDLWITLMLLLAVIAAVPAFGAVEERKPERKGTIEGEVLRIDQDRVVVKDKEGKEIVLNLGKQADVEPGIKAGDQVEAFVTPQGITTSVQPLKGGLRR
jgi:ribosomal protein S1